MINIIIFGSFLLEYFQFFIWIFPADLKEELEKEKESQNAIRKRIEEETKTTGGEDVIFVFLYLYVRGLIRSTESEMWGMRAIE